MTRNVIVVECAREIFFDDRCKLMLFFDQIPHRYGGTEENERYVLPASGFGKNGVDSGGVTPENVCEFHSKLPRLSVRTIISMFSILGNRKESK